MKTLVTLLFCLTALNLPAQTPPNIIIMLMDDMGVNDIGAYTYPSKLSPGPPPAVAPSPDSNLPPPNSAYDANAVGLSITPHIDSLADDGVRFTRFYATHPVCTPTRGSLLTGSYATRIGLESVVGPYGDGPTGLEATGLNSTELTLPELLREKGYATGMSGKWHLGHHIDFNPTRHGFEHYFGILYSNDMWTNNPYSATNWGDLALMNNETALGTYTTDTGRTITGPISTDEEQSYLLEAMTDDAVDFIDQSVAASKPFFLYYSPHTPHMPIHPHPDFLSVAGQTDDVARYYDLIREVDARVGEILGRLDTHGIANNTIVIFTSDNGPWQNRGGAGNLEQGCGSAYPFRGAKNSTYEGGHRVPFIARFPGQIPAGSVRDQLGVTFDLFTTLALQAGVTLPTDRVIDGLDIWPLLTGSSLSEIHDKFYYYDAGKNSAEGIMDMTTAEKWKLVSGSTSPAHNGLFRIGSGFTGDFQELSNVSGANSSVNSALTTALNTWNSNITRRTKGLSKTVSIEVENDAVTVDESGTATTRIRLSSSANATVNVARFTGDTDLDVSAGATLSFTTGNWNVWQTVTFAFPGDLDLVSQSAIFRASSGSLHVREIFVFENDLGAVAPPANPPPDNVLRLRYAFDETTGSTADDSSSFANDGAVAGSTGWVAGRVGNAIDFPAVSEGYVTSASAIDGNNTTGLSAAAWVRLDAAATTQNRWILQQMDGTGTGRTLLAVQPDGKLYTFIGAMNTAGGSISLGVWHHVAITAGSGTVTLYVDGQSVASVAASVESNNAAFRVGNHKILDLAKQWDGVIDEVRIYDGVLTSNEVLYLATGDPTVPTITAIANQAIELDTTVGPLAFTIGDDATPAVDLVVTKTSSNTTLLPLSGITLGGTGAGREVTLAPAAGQTGSSLVTLTVTDGDSKTASTSFTLTVTAPPVATAIVVTPAAPTVLTGNTQQFSAVLDDQFGQPMASQPTFTWNVTGGGTISGTGLFTAGSTAGGPYTVSAMAASLTGNTSVTVTQGAVLVNETWAGYSDNANLNGVAVQSGTGLTGNWTVVNASAGVGAQNSGAGDTKTYTAGTGDTQFTFTGGYAEPLNDFQDAVLSAGISAPITGDVYFRFSFFLSSLPTATGITDSGIWMNLGADKIGFFNNVNPSQIFVGTTPGGGTTSNFSMTAGTVNAVVGKLTYSGGAYTSATVWLNPTSNQESDLTALGTKITGAALTAALTEITELSFGWEDRRVASQLGLGAVTLGKTFADIGIISPPANTAPTITAIADQTIGIDTATDALAFTIDDAETAAAGLTVTGESSNLTLVPTENIVIGGSGAARTVIVTPATGQSGAATITLTVSDGDLSAQTTFEVTVNAAPASGYSDWKTTAFPESATAGDRSPGFDFDRDGLVNLLEYGLGTDPSAASTAPAAQVVEITGQKYLQIQWTRPDDRTDITTVGEISPDLGALSWTSDAGEVTTTIEAAAPGFETVTIRDFSPLATNPRRFMRARIILNAP